MQKTARKFTWNFLSGRLSTTRFLRVSRRFASGVRESAMLAPKLRLTLGSRECAAETSEIRGLLAEALRNLESILGRDFEFITAGTAERSFCLTAGTNRRRAPT